MIDEGVVYTSGRSFRASAEANARRYRATILKLADYDTYGHWLSDNDAESGYNFLPSLREQIFSAVMTRHAQGKGIGLKRTTKNMLSSQAMCFNLFTPLNRDRDLAVPLLDTWMGGVREISSEIQLEFTPPALLFGDQSGRGGVDCDALIRFLNKEDEQALAVVETKYVEKEFSICGFRKPGHKNPCPDGTMIRDDFSSCRYHSLKHYRYWLLASESDLFDLDILGNKPCPFGGRLWQLWVNMILAYGLARKWGIKDYRYIVICPKQNLELTENGRTFEQFRECLAEPQRFEVIYLEDICSTLSSISTDGISDQWMSEFVERYCG